MNAWNFTEESVARVIEAGGRENAFFVLRLAEGILHGTVRPSPVVAKWFSAALGRILAGETADTAFCVKRGPGADPLANLDEKMRRDSDILRLVEEAIRRGHPTAENKSVVSCFAEAAKQTGRSEGTVRAVYYEWRELFRSVEEQ